MGRAAEALLNDLRSILLPSCWSLTGLLSRRTAATACQSDETASRRRDWDLAVGLLYLNSPLRVVEVMPIAYFPCSAGREVPPVRTLTISPSPAVLLTRRSRLPSLRPSELTEVWSGTDMRVMCLATSHASLLLSSRFFIRSSQSQRLGRR